MTILDELHIFGVGDKVTAQETNDNNKTLESWIRDRSDITAYINSKVEEINNQYSGQISSINMQLSEINSQVSGLNKNALKNSYTKNGGTGCLRMDNGTAIEWGAISVAGGEHTYNFNFQKGFSGDSYVVAGSWTPYQNAGDKSITWRVVRKQSASVTLGTQLNGANSQSAKIFIIAIGKWK